MSIWIDELCLSKDEIIDNPEEIAEDPVGFTEPFANEILTYFMYDGKLSKLELLRWNYKCLSLAYSIKPTEVEQEFNQVITNSLSDSYKIQEFNLKEYLKLGVTYLENLLDGEYF